MIFTNLSTEKYLGFPASEKELPCGGSDLVMFLIILEYTKSYLIYHNPAHT